MGHHDLTLPAEVLPGAVEGGPMRNVAENADDVRLVEDLRELGKDVQDVVHAAPPGGRAPGDRAGLRLSLRLSGRWRLTPGAVPEGVEGPEAGLVAGPDQLEIGAKPLVEQALAAFVFLGIHGTCPLLCPSAGEPSAAPAFRQEAAG